ncbi:hypothetical protein C9374_000099 [Naegleria lovaniensis]|uniref:Uncharacterized protein n=1 Tax=Naegleria lovaniensis TaxID=51637 RepID=A0AA88KM77_NAELO|nr:uncharacterized protein C9374_000099 [Naegleria lovaniensis]KAG2388660.1 hypothetical protein C9374_000099 [Naegleria lovaniensis]
MIHSKEESSSSSTALKAPNYTLQFSEPKWSESPEFPSNLRTQLKSCKPSCAITLDQEGAGKLTIQSKHDCHKSYQYTISGFVYDSFTVPIFMTSVNLNFKNSTLIRQHGDLYFALYPNYILGGQRNQLKVPVTGPFVDGEKKMKGLKETLDYISNNFKDLAPWRIKDVSIVMGDKISENDQPITVSVELPNIQRNQLKAFKWNLLIYLYKPGSDNGVCPFVIYTSTEICSFSKRHFTENDVKTKKPRRGDKRKQIEENDEPYLSSSETGDDEQDDGDDEQESTEESEDNSLFTKRSRRSARNGSISTSKFFASSSKDVSSPIKKSKNSEISEGSSTKSQRKREQQAMIENTMKDLEKIMSENSNKRMLNQQTFTLLQLMMREMLQQGKLDIVPFDTGNPLYMKLLTTVSTEESLKKIEQLKGLEELNDHMFSVIVVFLLGLASRNDVRKHVEKTVTMIFKK